MEGVIETIEKYWVERHFDIEQRDFFIDILSSRNVKYCLETGFASGTSAATTLAACNPEKMISVSLANNDLSVSEKLERDFNFKLIVGDSLQILNDNFFEKEFSYGIDFYFVDGGHEGIVPLLDLDSCLKYLNDDFLIIVDDYHSQMCPCPDVDVAVDTFVRDTGFDLKFFDTASGKGMAVITD
jgi:predicted O-methyltransferase YrrM